MNYISVKLLAGKQNRSDGGEREQARDRSVASETHRARQVTQGRWGLGQRGARGYQAGCGECGVQRGEEGGPLIKLFSAAQQRE